MTVAETDYQTRTSNPLRYPNDMIFGWIKCCSSDLTYKNALPNPAYILHLHVRTNKCHLVICLYVPFIGGREVEVGVQVCHIERQLTNRVSAVNQCQNAALSSHCNNLFDRQSNCWRAGNVVENCKCNCAVVQGVFYQG